MFLVSANGNLLYVNRGVKTSDSTLQVNHSRKMLWDEENRLQAVSDNGFVSNYYYDASGERTVKLSGASQGVYVNGALNSATTQTNRFTAYINPNLVLNSGGYYSKHIYAGTQRIVSKLGSSEIFLSVPTFSSLPSGKLTGLTATVKARYDSLGVAYHGTPQGMNGFETSASGKINTPQLYFYHADHLGSSSLITDNNGLLVQHLQYLPFGEVFIDERKGSWHTPFTFSAKEQDEETGLHYFSARYYDSRTSTWFSVDPLGEKYPNLSSYVYCHNNPINMIDPDGMADYYTNQGKYLGNDHKNDKFVFSANKMNEDGTFDGAKLLPVSTTDLNKKSSTVYGESTAYKSKKSEELKKEMYAIASVHERNDKAYGGSSENAQANDFRSKSKEERNGTKMEFAVGAVINAVTGGFDYSNGATMWDGAEQSYFPASDKRGSTGKWELHMNTMGWNIKDEHYSNWKANIGDKFKAPQLRVSPQNYPNKNYYNKGQTRLHSTAVYNQTIFWKIK